MDDERNKPVPRILIQKSERGLPKINGEGAVSNVLFFYKIWSPIVQSPKENPPAFRKIATEPNTATFGPKLDNSFAISHCSQLKATDVT